jgi:hypothetical protein
MAQFAAQRFGPIAEGFEVRFDSMNPQPAALDRRPRSAQALEQSQVMDRPLSREEIVTLLEVAY